jgi:hypothetical protein
MIFIVGNHKSGTSLLRALLDGHPDLAVVPFETHFAEVAGVGSTYPLWRTGVVHPSNAPTEALLQTIELALGRQNVMGGGHMPWLSLGEAIERCPQVAPTNRPTDSWLRSFLSAAYLATTGEQVGERRIVEKSVENAEHVSWLVGLSEDVRVVQISREATTTAASLRRYFGGLSERRFFRYPPLRRVVDGLAHTAVHCARNQLLFPDQVLSLEYEALVTDTRGAMTDVSQFLGLDFQPSLLIPTVVGKDWSGNSSTGDSKSGVVSTRPRDRAPALERALLERRISSSSLSEIVGRAGPWGFIQLLLPRKREGLRSYLLNRAALFER